MSGKWRYDTAEKVAAIFTPGTNVATMRGSAGGSRQGIVVVPTEELLAQYHTDLCVPVRWFDGQTTWIRARHLVRADI